MGIIETNFIVIRIVVTVHKGQEDLDMIRNADLLVVGNYSDTALTGIIEIASIVKVDIAIKI